MIVQESDTDYHARPGVSASLLWDIVGPDGCPALAWHRSPWLNPDAVREDTEELDIGIAVHLACLQPDELEARTLVVSADSWRSKNARLAREIARAEGKVPLLLERAHGVSWRTIGEMREALRQSPAAPLLFDGGDSEVTFTWEIDGTPCKGRADRIIRDKRIMLDLKSSPTASVERFQTAVVRDGHHLRHAWYLDGWGEQDGTVGAWDYQFLVIGKTPPYLAALYRLEERAVAWGQQLWRSAFQRFQTAQRTGRWGGYAATIQTVGLPVWAEHQLADREFEGEL